MGEGDIFLPGQFIEIRIYDLILYESRMHWIRSVRIHGCVVNHLIRRHFCYALNARRFHSQGASSPPGGITSRDGASFIVSGATAATLLMLGVLHARRLYDDKKLDDAREKRTELEFYPDFKASFLRVLPLRAMSRFWGFLTSIEVSVWLRPYVYKAWARAFHSNLEEAALPLDEYCSLRDLFVRRIKEGLRIIDSDPQCLVSPVDGIVLRFGELKRDKAMIEQVKGFSYSASSLLGTNLFLGIGEDKYATKYNNDPSKGIFYCVLYLKPGDYHRIHSPVEWTVLVRRHFSGRLFPVNERAVRTIRNLFVENERVVLEGIWKEGFMALVAIGATNVGSIELSMEPELRTNIPIWSLFAVQPPKERMYNEGTGVILKKGDEVGAFNMGSTVVLVFNADSTGFRFCVERGGRIRVGEALGRTTL